MKHYEFRERLVRGLSGFSTSSCTREAESAGKRVLLTSARYWNINQFLFKKGLLVFTVS